MNRRTLLLATLLVAGACDQDRLTGLDDVGTFGPPPAGRVADRVGPNLAIEDALDRVLPTFPAGSATLALESALISLRDGSSEMGDLFLADAFDALAELEARTEGYEADLDVVRQALDTLD